MKLGPLAATLALLAIGACGPTYLDNPNLTPGDECRAWGNEMHGATCVPLGGAKPSPGTWCDHIQAARGTSICPSGRGQLESLDAGGVRCMCLDDSVWP